MTALWPGFNNGHVAKPSKINLLLHVSISPLILTAFCYRVYIWFKHPEPFISILLHPYIPYYDLPVSTKSFSFLFAGYTPEQQALTINPLSSLLFAFKELFHYHLFAWGHQQLFALPPYWCIFPDIFSIPSPWCELINVQANLLLHFAQFSFSHLHNCITLWPNHNDSLLFLFLPTVDKFLLHVQWRSHRFQYNPECAFKISIHSSHLSRGYIQLGPWMIPSWRASWKVQFNIRVKSVRLSYVSGMDQSNSYFLQLYRQKVHCGSNLSDKVLEKGPREAGYISAERFTVCGIQWKSGNLT